MVGTAIISLSRRSWRGTFPRHGSVVARENREEFLHGPASSRLVRGKTKASPRTEISKAMTLPRWISLSHRMPHPLATLTGQPSSPKPPVLQPSSTDARQNPAGSSGLGTARTKPFGTWSFAQIFAEPDRSHSVRALGWDYLISSARRLISAIRSWLLGWVESQPGPANPELSSSCSKNRARAAGS